MAVTSLAGQCRQHASIENRTKRELLMRNQTKRELLTRKFGLAAGVALTALTAVCFISGWMASTTASVAAPPMSNAGIAPLQMMTGSSNLPTEHFVDYSLVFTP
jgi:hypothetical protein